MGPPPRLGWGGGWGVDCGGDPGARGWGLGRARAGSGGARAGSGRTLTQTLEVSSMASFTSSWLFLLAIVGATVEIFIPRLSGGRSAGQSPARLTTWIRRNESAPYDRSFVVHVACSWCGYPSGTPTSCFSYFLCVYGT